MENNSYTVVKSFANPYFELMVVKQPVLGYSLVKIFNYEVSVLATGYQDYSAISEEFDKAMVKAIGH